MAGAAIGLAAPAAAAAPAAKPPAWRLVDFSGTQTVTSFAAPFSTCQDAGGAPISDSVAARYTTTIELGSVERRKDGQPDIRVREKAGRTKFAPVVRLALTPTALEAYRTLTPVPGSQPEACTEGVQTCTQRDRSADTESVNFTGLGKRVTVRFPARLVAPWFAHCAPRGAALLVPPLPKSRFFLTDGVAKVFSFSAFDRPRPVLTIDKTFKFAPEPGQAGSPGGTIRYQATIRLRRIAG